MYKVKISEPEPKTIRGILPPLMDEQEKIYSNILNTLEPMITDNTSSYVEIESAFAKEMMASYAGNAPSGLNIGSNVCCHGAGVQVTTYRVYRMETRAARSPEQFNSRYGHYPRIYITERGNTYQVATMRGPRSEGLGRAGGDIGWDKLRDAFAYALASFKHNFEALIGAFSSRPKIPCSEHWTLPNLVYSKEITDRERRYNASIVKPPVAVPPASYTFSLTAPAPMMILAVGTKCPREVKTYCEFWDSSKNNMTDAFEVTFPEGDSETLITLQGGIFSPVQKGFFNINPVNSEMTVSYVDLVFPPI
ncbi:MAG: hypothetical protein DRN25_05525 [Thermoplasmata archaeon]|nr:MAG: hypothetical protein DRN25_05525 [Thermoplasmata archaeon]